MQVKRALMKIWNRMFPKCDKCGTRFLGPTGFEYRRKGKYKEMRTQKALGIITVLCGRCALHQDMMSALGKDNKWERRNLTQYKND